jgi:hypothetical protein
MFSRLISRSRIGKKFLATTTQVLHQNKKFSSMNIFATAITATAGITLSGLYLTNLSEASSYDLTAVKKDIAKAIEIDAEKRGDGLFLHSMFLTSLSRSVLSVSLCSLCPDSLSHTHFLCSLSPPLPLSWPHSPLPLTGTSMAPTLVRLAWHASGTYSAADNTGGSNGATMRFPQESDWGANAGLKIARDFLEPIKAKYPSLTYADLWTLAGATAIEEMGGPSIPWRGGRVDSQVPTTVPDGRLPAADSGCVAADVGHLRAIFGRMGFSDREIVALAGAHAVGRCHTEASGYWGPWTNAETTFSNEYFRLLLEEKWTLKKTHNGKVRGSTQLLSFSSP